MPTIKTIKPAGGGDFTTLQDWWDWAKTQATGDQWAEMYSGDMEPLDTSGGTTFTPDAVDFPYVYPATPFHHALSVSTSKAYLYHETGRGLNLEVPYMRVEGLQILATVDCGEYNAVRVAASDVVCEGLLIVGNSVTSPAGSSGFTLANGGTSTLRNCIVVYGRTAYVGAGTGTYIMQNCASFGVLFWAFGTVNFCTFLPTNCYAVSSSPDQNFMFGGFTGSPSPNYCASSDGTADDFGGTGNITGVSVSGQVLNSASDWRTLPTSDFVDAGDDLSADFTTDAVGNTRATPWWIGPFQGDIGAYKTFWASGANQLIGGRPC